MDFDDETARGGFELDLENFRRGVMAEDRKGQKKAEQIGHVHQTNFPLFFLSGIFGERISSLFFVRSLY